MGAPSIYVYDCSSAGQIVDSFNLFASQRQVRRGERSARYDWGGGSAEFQGLIWCHFDEQVSGRKA